MKKDLAALVEKRWEAGRQGKNSVGLSGNNVSEYLNRVVMNRNVKGKDDRRKVFVNLAMVIVENLNSLASDTQLTSNIFAELPGYDLDAQVYQALSNWVDANNNMPIKRVQNQKFGLLEGTGIFKLHVGDLKYGEKGWKKIGLDIVDPKNIVCDPVAKNIDELKYVVETVMYDKEKLKKLYPQYDMTDGEDGDNEVSEYNMAEEQDGGKVTVREMWSNEDIGHVIKAGNQVLIKEKNPFNCIFPFVFIPFIMLPDRIFGKDIYGYIKILLDKMNEMFQRVEQIIYKTANPVRAINQQQVNGDTVTNEDGININCKGDVRTAVQWMPQSQLNPALVDYAKLMEYYMMSLGGVNEYSGRQASPSSLPSGDALEEMRMAKETRLREFVRNLKDGFRQLGEKKVSMTHQFFPMEQVVKITGGDAQEILKVMERDKIEALQKLQQAGARTPEEISQGMKVWQKEKGIGIVNTTKVDTYLKFTGNRLGDPNIFTIRVEGGTDVPKSKLDMAQRADMLMGAGMIDPESYFEITDFPYKEKILERSQDWQAYQQFKQQRAEQMKQQAEVQKSQQKKQMTQQAEQQVQGMPQ